MRLRRPGGDGGRRPEVEELGDVEEGERAAGVGLGHEVTDLGPSSGAQVSGRPVVLLVGGRLVERLVGTVALQGGAEVDEVEVPPGGAAARPKRISGAHQLGSIGASSSGYQKSIGPSSARVVSKPTEGV